MQISSEQRRQAFSVWLRTGWLPSPGGRGGLELKFNPWHDPENGRFTFAGHGRYYGRGREIDPKRAPQNAPTIVIQENPHLPKLTSAEEVEALTAKLLAEHGDNSANRALIEAQRQRLLAGLSSSANSAVDQQRSRPEVIKFAEGLGEAVYDVASGTVTGIYSLLTTSPLTSIRNIEFGIAGTIDSALEAEDTPAHVQFSRAFDAVTHASAHDIGYAAGTLIGDVGLGFGSRALVYKFSALRGVDKGSAVEPASPQVTWLQETNTATGFAKDYNDSALGAYSDAATRRSRVPALPRTMEDGSIRFVKFDGLDANTLIDRKWTVVTAPNGKAQALRQSIVLKQHGLIGRWEVPSLRERRKAMRMLHSLGITNIGVLVVKHDPS
ncbi:hypothetical protein [Sphingosinithalassobacter sp. CS137]|uniref:hypothetical protein n=1 Tax=Sphingosinithalassobacter sp. CS137 TaxID=2762748 RepID=UPI00165EA188|nr:hypothetical protein [Sphingosinithalassobacter sp. CS137]